MDKKTVTITQDEYNSLRLAECELRILNEWGVDNWQGYEECDWDELKDMRKQFEKPC